MHLQALVQGLIQAVQKQISLDIYELIAKMSESAVASVIEFSLDTAPTLIKLYLP